MIPKWAMRLPLNLIYSKATDAEIDPMLVAAICFTESSGFVYAVRFEPGYRWLHEPEKYAKMHRITVETEKTLQAQSFGLGQIMGATSRWLGFSGPLPALYKPENNLFWTCKYLKYLIDKHGNLEKAVAAYNAGSPRVDSDGKFVNQGYVDKVFGYYRELVKTG